MTEESAVKNIIQNFQIEMILDSTWVHLINNPDFQNKCLWKEYLLIDEKKNLKLESFNFCYFVEDGLFMKLYIVGSKTNEMIFNEQLNKIIKEIKPYILTTDGITPSRRIVDRLIEKKEPAGHLINITCFYAVIITLIIEERPL